MNKQITHTKIGERSGEIAHSIHTPVLSTKLHRPPLPVDFVPRTELLKNLDKHGHVPLALVTAPAGYGKSTLISSWIESCGVPSAWVSLDKKDNDLRVFLTYLVTAVDGLFAGSLKRIGNLLNAVELPTRELLSQTLINELDEINQKFILVLDDYHHIEEKLIHDLIEAMLRYPPRNMRMTILSRRDPPLPLHDLRAHGKIVEFRMQELSFKANEISELFEKLHGFSLDENLSLSLLNKTEGWITGLRMTALSINRSEDILKLLESMQRVSMHAITEFLIEEVLAKQHPDNQKNLLRASILNRFCADLLDEFFSTDKQNSEAKSDGASFLNWLEKAGMFVIPLDHEHRWFRYHHLFQELLQNRLKKHLTNEEIKTDHINVSAWFEKQGLIEEAIEHALAAENVERAAQIVERNRQNALNTDQMFLLEKWLSRLPDTVIRERAGLLLAQAWVFHHQLRFAELLPVIDQVESLLQDGSDQEALRGEVAFFRGYFQFFLNDGAGSLKSLDIALTHVPDSSHEVRAQTEIFFGLASQMEGQKKHALTILDGLLNGHPPPNDLRKSRLLATHMYLHIIAGDLVKAEPYGRPFNETARARHFVYAEAWSDYLPGLIHLYRNELDKAVFYLERSVAQRFVHHDRAAVDSLVGLMMAYEALGNWEKVRETQQILREYADARSDPAFATMAGACDARLAILQGRTPVAVRWLAANESPAPEVMIWWFEIPCITYCRLLVAEGSSGNLTEAEERLREYAAMNEGHHNICQLIQILPLLAMACGKQGKTEEALEILERAVSLAQPGRFVFPFMECGPLMVDMLEHLAAAGAGGYHVETLLDALKKKPSDQGSNIQDHRGEELITNKSGTHINEHESLTQRETEIVGLLAEGLKNKEIAANLYLSTTTVKKHIYNIYQKWNVHSRVSVVVKAQDLGIVD